MKGKQLTRTNLTRMSTKLDCGKSVRVGQIVTIEAARFGTFASEIEGVVVCIREILSAYLVSYGTEVVIMKRDGKLDAIEQSKIKSVKSRRNVPDRESIEGVARAAYDVLRRKVIAEYDKIAADDTARKCGYELDELSDRMQGISNVLGAESIMTVAAKSAKRTKLGAFRPEKYFYSRMFGTAWHSDGIEVYATEDVLDINLVIESDKYAANGSKLCAQEYDGTSYVALDTDDRKKKARALFKSFFDHFGITAVPTSGEYDMGVSEKGIIECTYSLRAQLKDADKTEDGINALVERLCDGKKK